MRFHFTADPVHGGKREADRDGIPPCAVFPHDAANRNANEPGNRNDNLGFRLAGAQTQPRAERARAAPDQTAVATGARAASEQR